MQLKNFTRRYGRFASLLLALALIGCDVAIRKVDSVDPVRIGGELTYTITVTSEQAPASPAQRAQIRNRRANAQAPNDVIVTDNLPAGVTVQTVTTTEGSCDQSGNTITCNLGPLSGDWSETITITVLVNSNAASEICNTAVVEASDDVTEDNNLARECTTVIQNGRPSATPTITPTATSTPEDKDNKRKLTELQKLNQEKTFTGGFSDVGTEGIIIGYRNGADSPLVLAPNIKLPEPLSFNINDPAPFILIANVDGIVQVRLYKDATELIDRVRLGYYFGAEGEKQSEYVFDAYDADQKRK